MTARARLLSASEVAETDPVGQIYALRCTSFVKIGWTQHIRKRINQIQSSNPRKITLIGTVLGTVGDEADFHLVLRHERVRGEWFRCENLTQMAVDLFDECETAKDVLTRLKLDIDQRLEALAERNRGREGLDWQDMC